jgi:E3 ubiquitin-protein ligase synoviolin
MKLIVLDFLKFAAYLTFFGVLTVLYGLPIYIVRDLYMTGRSFYNRVNDYRQYRNATHNMHNQYPDATAESLVADNTCIVCREDMKPWIGTLPAAEQAANRNTGNFSISERQRPKKLPCGHILHFSCLRSWLERQQACPICRRSVLRPLTVPGDAAQPPANGAPREPGQPQAVGNGARNGAPRPAPQPNRARRPVGVGFRLGPFRFFFGRLDGDEAVNRLVRGGNGGRQRNGQNPAPLPVPRHRHGAVPAPFVPQLPGATGQPPTATAEASTEPGSTDTQAANQSAVPDPEERFSRSLQAHSLHAHLTAIEHMIQQDVRSLNLAEQRIQTIHWLLSEVERARAEAASQQSAIQPVHLQSRMPNQEVDSGAASSSSASQVILDHQGNMLTTLPQGWTVIPFQPVPQTPAGQASTGGEVLTIVQSPATAGDILNAAGDVGTNGESTADPAPIVSQGQAILQPTPTQPSSLQHLIQPDGPVEETQTVTSNGNGSQPVAPVISNGASWSFGNLEAGTESSTNGTNGTGSRPSVETRGSSSAVSANGSATEGIKRGSHQPSVEDEADG